MTKLVPIRVLLAFHKPPANINVTFIIKLLVIKDIRKGFFKTAAIKNLLQYLDEKSYFSV